MLPGLIHSPSKVTELLSGSPVNHVTLLGADEGVAFTQAYSDTINYVDLLLAHGGPDIRSNGVFEDLLNFATVLYAQAGGRTDFWALRSTHNIGHGSTVLSWLGQVGTLFNGPTWTDEGIHTSGNGTTDDYIAIPDVFAAGNSNFHALIVAKSDIVAASRQTPFAAGDNNSPTETIRIDSPNISTVGDYAVVTFHGLFTLSIAGTDRTWHALGHSVSNVNYYARNNSAMQSASTSDVLNMPASSQSVGLGKIITPSAGHFQGSHSFFAHIPRVLTEAENSAIYAAYKSTIGQGLGLP